MNHTGGLAAHACSDSAICTLQQKLCAEDPRGWMEASCDCVPRVGSCFYVRAFTYGLQGQLVSFQIHLLS